ncbi:MAG: transcription antitermination factor NusB, partial [Deltaproteobacteria bacterium]
TRSDICRTNSQTSSFCRPILFLEDIPPRVSLDEAVELGKKFGSENSARYINGVLDHIYTTLGIDSTGEKG